MALVIALLLPKWFLATARILPPQQSQSNTITISELGGLSPLRRDKRLAQENPSDVYVAILRSRTIADAIIKRFDLIKLYDEDTLVDTQKEFIRPFDSWRG